MSRVRSVLALLLASLSVSAAAKEDTPVQWYGKKQQARLTPASPEQASCLFMSGTKLTAGRSNVNKAIAGIHFHRDDSKPDDDDFLFGIQGRPNSKGQVFEIRQEDRFGSTDGVCLAPGKYLVERIQFMVGMANVTRRLDKPIEFELEAGKDYYLGEFVYAEQYAPSCLLDRKERPECMALIEIRDSLARDEPLFQADTTKPRGKLERLRFTVQSDWTIVDHREPVD